MKQKKKKKSSSFGSLLRARELPMTEGTYLSLPEAL